MIVNAVAESFFNLLKRERIRRRTYKTREAANLRVQLDALQADGVDPRHHPVLATIDWG